MLLYPVSNKGRNRKIGWEVIALMKVRPKWWLESGMAVETVRVVEFLGVF